VWHYIAQNKVDYHPLHDEFYPSIGCAPCTRAISLGEDFRAGRWWWENGDTTKECGLHVKPLASDSSQFDVSAQADFAPGEVKASTEAGRSQDEAAKECGLHVKNANEGVAA
jgi:phosphoadenosine phosphosulfate reductase